MATARHLGHDAVNLAFGADVDAARRFIKQQNARTDGDPAGDQQLLLIAAGKAAGPHLCVRHANIKQEIASSERVCAFCD